MCIRLWAAAAASALMVAMSSAALGAEAFVSPSGSDTWSGRLPSPNRSRTDGPFATLERACEWVRSERAGMGAVVSLRNGTYECSSTLALGPEDGGASRNPAVYRAYRDERPILCGGKAVDGWSPVTDDGTLARMSPVARAHTVVTDLAAAGIKDFGRLTRRGFGRPVTPAALELFFRGKPMQLARWPNGEWTTISGVPDGKDGGRFTYEGGRPAAWHGLSDVWVHGYWTYDWADTYERVTGLDAASRTVTTEAPHGAYGYAGGKRFYFLNVLEELDAPGEWYLDRASGKLYFWPPEPMRDGDAVVSMLETPLVTLSGASNVRIEGLTFECSRGSGVEVTDGSGVTVRHCTFRNLGTNAVTVHGGTGHTVTDCHIHDIGETAISISGGDRKTLTPGRHQALRNHIHDFSRWCRTYRPAIALNGVGNRVANNAIHDAPHNAILMGGNEHIVELNDIARVCLQTGDAGAIYMGRNMTMRGNVIRWNYFHDITRTIGGSGGFVDVMSVYLDDCFCGTTIYGNVFVRAGRAAMIGGGRDNRIENNIFVDCTPAVHVDSRGIGWAKFWFDGRDPFIMDGLKDMHHDKPPYSERYPELVGLLDDNPGFAKGNVVARNVSIGGTWRELHDGLNDETVRFDGNITDGDPGFVSVADLDFRLRRDSILRKPGFVAIPFSKIGLPSAVATPWSSSRARSRR